MLGPITAVSSGELNENVDFAPGPWPKATLRYGGEGMLFPGGPHEVPFSDIGDLELTLLAGSEPERAELQRLHDLNKLVDLRGLWRLRVPLRWEASVTLFDDDARRIATWSGSATGVPARSGVTATYVGTGLLVLLDPHRLGLPGKAPLRMETVIEDHVDWDSYHWRLWQWHFDVWPIRLVD